MPDNEAQRVSTLRSCNILDTEPDPAFDGIALLASQLCGTPSALVSFVDKERQWFKARVGIAISETPRDIAFCAYSIMSDVPLVVEDAKADPRFADNPFVTGEPYVRFYAGVPLVLDDGSAVGALCVLDKVPRQLTGSQLSSLQLLARQVTTQIGLRRKLASSIPPMLATDATFSFEASPTLDQTTLRGTQRSTHERGIPIPVGSIISQRYRIEAVIGEGGMGVVARAVDGSNGERVAIKFMLGQALARPDAVARFVREARVLLKMNSPHVARVLDLGNLPGGEPFIVMEYVEGEDLKARLDRQGTLGIDEVIQVGIQLCRALGSAHEHGILHRDLKPANLILAMGSGAPYPDTTENAVLKVLDFGISKLVGDVDDNTLSPLTSDATIVGSPHYMSPEQMVTPSRVDARSDLWSVGVVLFELLTGFAPFDGKTLTEVCAQVLTVQPPLLHEVRREVSRELSALVARLLAKHPEQRYQHAAELELHLATLALARP